MAPRLHADELAPSGGAELAAELGAASADHLATPSEAGIDALAEAAATDHPVVATLLPHTTWFLMKDHHAPARPLIERGVPVAIGTDFNPGTSPTASLPLAMTAACVGLRMTPDEVLGAVTINAARALLLEDEIGSLEPGKAADLVVWRVPTTHPDPVLAGRRPRADRRSSAAAWSRVGPLRSGLLASRGTRAGPAVVSAGRLEIDTDSFGCVVGSAPISWKNLASASAQSASSSHSGIGTTILGSSWATSAAALVGLSVAAERHADDVDGPDVAELLLGQEVADVAEVDRVQAVELDDERDLLARLGALGVVAIGPHAGDEDLLDLVLAGTVEDERVVEARRQVGVAVARELALRPGELVVVGVAERDDVAGDAAPGRADDRLVGIGHDDRVATAKADAGASVPGEFHGRDSDTAACTGAHVRAGHSRTRKDRRRLPNRRPRSEGGRKEPCGFVRVTTLRAADSGSRRQPVKKATRRRAGTIVRRADRPSRATIRR